MKPQAAQSFSHVEKLILPIFIRALVNCIHSTFKPKPLPLST